MNIVTRKNPDYIARIREQAILARMANEQAQIDQAVNRIIAVLASNKKESN